MAEAATDGFTSPAPEDNPAGGGPPRPRLVLRVGVVGHRPNKLPEDTGALKGLLAQTFASIESVAAEQHRLRAGAANPCPLFSARKPLLRLVTGMAEGADLLAAAEVLSRRRDDYEAMEWEIDALLAGPRDLFAAEAGRLATHDGAGVAEAVSRAIEAADRVTELPAPLAPRAPNATPAAPCLDYGILAAFLLRQIDILIAVWDGQGPAGAGGTGAIVRLALEEGLSIVWIDPGGGRAPCLLDGVERLDANGRVIEEGLSRASCLNNDLPRTLTRLLLPLGFEASDIDPDIRPDQARVAEKARKRLTEFFSERTTPASAGKAFRVFERLATGTLFKRSPRPSAADDWRARNWDEFIEQGSAGGVAEAQFRFLRTFLFPRFRFVDELAVHYGDLYRGTYILAYFWSSIAVAFAVGGLLFGEHLLFLVRADEPRPDLIVELFFAIPEGIVLCYIVWRIRRGVRSSWHEKWLEYRALAEGLRHLRFLALTGEFSWFSEMPSSARAWWIWYVRCALREIGPPVGAIDAAYQQNALRATRIAEIEWQAGWHERNATKNKRIGHFLHRWEKRLYWTTCGLILLFALLETGVLSTRWLAGLMGASLVADGAFWVAHARIASALPILKELIGFAGPFFPALSATLFGIAHTGEFETAAERSETMARDLADLARRMEAAEKNQRLERTMNLMSDAAALLSSDLHVFSDVFGRKRLVLPH